MPLAVEAFNYINSYNFDNIDTEIEDNLDRTGCNCVDNCRDKMKCSCWQRTVQLHLRKSHGQCKYESQKRIGYENMRLMNIVTNGIVECGGRCKCCADKCVNRIAQSGIQHNLELFETKNGTGWGVRTKNDLPEGIL